MFEAYVNELRLLRRSSSDIKPSQFRHLETTRDPAGSLATVCGWTLWVSGEGAEHIAISWPWGLIHQGVPAIDPIKIQTNVMLVDGASQPLPEYQALALLVDLVNRLEWHDHALEASSVPTQ